MSKLYIFSQSIAMFSAGIADLLALPDVAQHVVQAPSIRLFPPYGLNASSRISVMPGDIVDRAVARFTRARPACILPLRFVRKTKTRR